MKKLLSLLSVFVLCFSLSAYSGGEDIYKKLKASSKETFSMSLSKKMIDFFDMDFDFNGKEKLITGDFHEGKMIVLEEVTSLKKIQSLFEQEEYELLKDEEEDEDVYLFISRKGNNVSEAHFVLSDKEEDKVTIVSIFGDIKVKNK